MIYDQIIAINAYKRKNPEKYFIVIRTRQIIRYRAIYILRHVFPYSKHIDGKTNLCFAR